MAVNEPVPLLSVEELMGVIGRVREMMDTDEEFGRELREGRPSGNPIQLGPRLPTAEDWADLQIAGAQANAEKWLKNTTAPKKNFKEEALRGTSIQRYKTSMQRVISEGTWEGGMGLVDESETMATIKRLGSSVYSNAISNRKPKIQRVVRELREDRLALAVTIDAMPVSTEGERENKMIQNVRGMRAIGARRRGAS